MKELTWIIDPTTGELTLEGMTGEEALTLVGDLLPAPTAINCARPLHAPVPAPGAARESSGLTLRVHSIYHGSVAEGPGRRSVLQTAGCSVRCPGCYLPELWAPGSGVELSIADLVDALLSPEGEPRDGISILGGEPLDQPEAVAAVMRELKARGQHLVLYSGRTLEALARRREPGVREALCLADILVDGPFVASLSDGAGEWRGSRNQRLIRLPGLWV